MQKQQLIHGAICLLTIVGCTGFISVASPVVTRASVAYQPISTTTVASQPSSGADNSAPSAAVFNDPTDSSTTGQSDSGNPDYGNSGSGNSSSLSSSSPPVVLNQQWVDGVPMTNQPEQFPSISSQAGVVMDMTTGTVVYAKDPLVQHYPASITKIMTAMLALQHGNLTDQVSVSQDAAIQPPDKLYFVPGEQEPLEQMLYGLLLISANDAAVAIAEKYGGSVTGFADMMNREAQELGATHTHFVNPNGLPDQSHVTTAYDMALIAKAAMQIPEFRKIVSTKFYSWQGQAWQSNLSNINHMLFNYPGCIGVKTGYTSVAHETLVVAATRGNSTFLAVLMDSPTNYSITHDATQLLDFAFQHYHTQVLSRSGKLTEEIKAGNNSLIPLYTNRDVEATVDSNSPIEANVNIKLRTLPSATVNQKSGSTIHLAATNGSFLSSGTSGSPAPNSWLHVGDISYAFPSQPVAVVPVFAPRSAFPAPVSEAVRPNALRRWWFIGGPVAGLIALLAGVVAYRRQRRRRWSPYRSSRQRYY